MKELIEQHYPGTKLGITEWNWGADKTMNGALAIANVLGVFGREDVYLASYWMYPEVGSPGFYAFKMYTNYDDNGSRFGDTSVQTTSSQPDQVASFASINSTSGDLTLMLINNNPDKQLTTALDLRGMELSQNGSIYRYSQIKPDDIVNESFVMDPNSTLTLPPYSITLLVVKAAKQ
jgi:hypothetical protein